MSSKQELRRRVTSLEQSYPVNRPVQTHSVFIGKFRIPGYQDGDVIRALADGEVVSRRTKRGWNEKVQAVHFPLGKWDDIKPLNRAPVVVELDKGKFY